MARRGHGEGTIYQRADGRWEAALSLGNGKRKSIYGKTRQEVARKLTAALREFDQGILPLQSERQTIEQYLVTWLEMIKPTVRYITWKHYTDLARLHFIPELGSIRLAKLTAQQVQLFYAKLLGEKQLSASSVHIYHTVLHRALKDALRLGLVQRNVCDMVVAPKGGSKEMHILAPEEVETFLKAAQGDRLEALYLLALATGMREGEILALKWRNLDLDGRSLQVKYTLHFFADGPSFSEPKTRASRRQVKLPPSVVEALRAHRARQHQERLLAGPLWQDYGLVFARADGYPLRGTSLLHTHFRPLLQRAGLPAIRFHDLRHTAATLLLIQSVNPKIVSELLGHSSVAITLDLYSHVLPSMQEQTAVIMENILHGHYPQHYPTIAAEGGLKSE